MNLIRSQKRAVLNLEIQFKAHLPSGCDCYRVYRVGNAPERTRGLLPRFKRSQKRAVLSQDPVKAHLPSGVRATENTKRYALKGHEKLEEKELDMRE